MIVTLSNRDIDDIGDLCTASDEEQQTLARVTEIDLTGNGISSFMKVFDTATNVNSNATTGQGNMKPHRSIKAEYSPAGGEGHTDDSFSDVPPSMSLSVLAPMKGLSKLILTRNKLGTNLVGLDAVCNTLSYLDVSYNKLPSLKGLERCTKLTYINAAYNNLTTLDGLPLFDAGGSGNRRGPDANEGDHANLTLIVSHNNLKSKSMKDLHLTVGLRLGYLDISFNKIESIQMVISTISNRQRFPLLKKVDLSVNPCLIPSTASEATPATTLAVSCPHIEVVATHPFLQSLASKELSERNMKESSKPNASNRAPQTDTDDSDSSRRIVDSDGTQYTIAKHNNSFADRSTAATTGSSEAINSIHNHQDVGNLRISEGSIISSDVCSLTGRNNELDKENEGKISHKKSKNGAYVERRHRQASIMLQNNNTPVIENELRNKGAIVTGDELMMKPKVKHSRTNSTSRFVGGSQSASVRSSVNQLPLHPPVSTSADIRELNDRLILEIDTVARLSDEIKLTKKDLQHKTKLVSESMETIRKQRNEIDELREMTEHLKIKLQKKNAEIECARVRTELAEQKYHNLEIQFDIAAQTNDIILSLDYQQQQPGHSYSHPQHQQRFSPATLESTSSDHKIKHSHLSQRSVPYSKEDIKDDKYTSHRIYSQIAEMPRINNSYPSRHKTPTNGHDVSGIPEKFERAATDVSIFSRGQICNGSRSSSRGHMSTGRISPRIFSRNYSHFDNKGNRACTSRAHNPKRGDFPHAHRSYVYPEDEVVEQVDPLLALKHNLDHRNIPDDKRYYIGNIGLGSTMLQSTTSSVYGSQLVGGHVSNTYQNLPYSRVSSQSQGDKMDAEKGRGQVIPAYDSHVTESDDMVHYTSDGVHDEDLIESEVEALETLCDEQSRYIDDICKENEKLLMLLKSEAVGSTIHTKTDMIGQSGGNQNQYRPNHSGRPMSSKQHHIDRLVYKQDANVNKRSTHQGVYSSENNSQQRYERYAKDASETPVGPHVRPGSAGAHRSALSIDSSCHLPSPTSREGTAVPSSSRYMCSSNHDNEEEPQLPATIRNDVNQNNDEDESEKSLSQDSDVPLCQLYPRSKLEQSIRNDSMMVLRRFSISPTPNNSQQRCEH